MIDTRELEEAIVGILMHQIEDFDYYMSKLKQEYFKFDVPKMIFNSIKNLKARKRPVDMLLVMGEMHDTYAGHKSISGDVSRVYHNAPPSTNLKHYIQELIDFRHKDTPVID